MKLLKPLWVSHDGSPIFSLDIHPDSSRFATGGQGAGDSGRVVIWNMSPVVSEQQEFKENVPKLLSRMDNHLNCVNCVRWSKDGKYLASAGDDKVILIWQIARIHSSSNNHPFLSSNSAESWRCVATLRGHSGDILDLNWCSTDPWLASCSVDNTIIVWNTQKWNQVLATLQAHTGLVKGVSFDPIGKYLASQSDDKSLKVWRTADWKEEFTLTKPFEECGGTTMFLRLDWSTDGQCLVSAHAMNNRGSVAQIIERDGWSFARDFVGHRKAVTCVRFSPVIYKKVTRRDEKEKIIQYCVLAVGSRDRSLSIWMTAFTRPLVVVHELFTSSVLDISWSSCGRKLVACSTDGSVAYIEFNEKELGKPLDKSETLLYLEKLYGKTHKNTDAMNHNILAEDIEFIKVREENTPSHVNGHANNSKDSEVNASVNANSSSNHHPKTNELTIDNRSMTDSRSSTGSRLNKGPTDKQIEVKMSNGKRRITPLYIPPPIDLDGIPIPFNPSQTTFATSEESKSKIPVEVRDDSNLSPMKESSNAHSSEADMRATSKLANHVSVDTARNSAGEPTKRKIPPSVAASSHPPAKKKPGRPANSGVKSSQVQVESVKPAVTSAVTSNEKAGSARTVEAKAGINLTPLDVGSTFSIPVSSSSKSPVLLVEVENKINGSTLCALRIKCTEKDAPNKWESILSNQITGVTSSDFLTAVSCYDNSISVFSTSTGRRLNPPVMLLSPAALLNSCDHYLIVITTNGHLSVFDFEKRKCLVKEASLVSLFTENNRTRLDLSIISASIISNGSPVVTLSNRRSFIYDMSFDCWSVMSEPSNQQLLNLCSDIVKQPTFSSKDSQVYPLAAVQSMHRWTRSSSIALSSNSHLQASTTLSFLDQQLASAFVMGSSDEYRHWLLLLTQTLTRDTKEERLRELCSFLLGPVFADPSDPNCSWPSTVLGHNKRQLLTEVLKIITSNIRLQRLYSEFKSQLTLAESNSCDSETESVNQPNSECNQ